MHESPSDPEIKHFCWTIAARALLACNPYIIPAMLKEFKEFAMKGNMLDLAIGVVLGAAFGKVVDSLVSNLLTPIVGALTGKVDFGALGFDIAGIKINYGMFLNALINFLIVAFALFFVVKAVNAMRKKEEAAPAPPSSEVVLLTEIRDALKAKG